MVLFLATPNLKSSFRCLRFSGSFVLHKNDNKKPHPNKNKESFPAEMCLSSPKKAEAALTYSANTIVKNARQKRCVQPTPCAQVTDYLLTSNGC